MGTPHLASSWVPLESRSAFGNAAMQRLDDDERPLWVAPALQAFSVDVRGHFRQYRRLSGLFVFWHCLHWP